MDVNVKKVASAEPFWEKERTSLLRREEKTSAVPSHVFVELTSLDELSFPTSSSTRIRYTCLNASPHYLAVGSTSGTVYLFSRYAAKYRKSLSSVPVQVIACKEGSVQHVSSSPNEKYLAVATSRGHVSIVSLVGNYPSVLLNNTVHVGQAVSCLCWISDSSKLFVGDTAGRISCSRVGNRNILRAACELVLELDSSIVQLDFASYHLLVSTMSRCYLYHISRYSCAQVGRKLRSGPYGACFFPSEDSEQPIVFCGRPSGRLWEVDSDGVVYSTHQFSSLLLAPSSPLITFRKPFDPSFDGATKDTISFEKLHVLSGEFLLTVNGSWLCVVDPKRARIVTICDFGEDVLQYAVCGWDLFVLTCHDGALRKLSLFPLTKAVEKLHWRECFGQAAQIMAAYHSLLPKLPWKLDMVENILLRMRGQSQEERDEKLLEEMAKVFERVKANEQKANVIKSSAIRLPTGVHRVLKVMDNSGYDDDFTFRAPSPLRASALRVRSVSTPSVDHSGNGLSSPEKRMSLPASSFTRDSQLVASRSQDSLLKLLSQKDQERTKLEIYETEASREEQVTKSVIPSPGRVGMKPLIGTPETLEEKMLRSLEVGGTKVLDSVERMADALVNFSMLPNEKQSQKGGRRQGMKTDISYPRDSMSAEYYSVSDYWSKPKEPPNPPTPLKPMPEVPSVIQVQRSNKSKPGGNKRKKHQHQATKMESVRGESPVSVSVDSRSLRDQELNNYRNSFTSSSSEKQVFLNGNVSSGITDALPQQIPSFRMTVSKPEYSRPSERFSGSYFSPYDEEEEEVSGIQRNAQMKMETEAGRRLCPRCGMHKSWLTLLRMGRYIKNIPVSDEEFLEGGVPSTLKDWVSLLNWRCSSEKKKRPGVDKSLCHSCLSAFDLLRGRLINEEMDDSVRKHPADLKVKSVAEFARKIPLGEFKSVIMGKGMGASELKEVPVVADSGSLRSVRYKDDLSEELAYSTYINPVYDSSEDGLVSPEWDEGSVMEGRKLWPWLRRAPLAGLLTAMAYVLGLKTVLETIKSHKWLQNAVTDDVWLCLGRLCGGRMDLALPRDILESVLRDSLGDCESDRVLTSLEERKEPSESFAVDATQNCPCCTLPLEAKVLRVSIIGFSCGHAFHLVCLKNQTVSGRETEEFRCIKCSYLAAHVSTV